ncbi:16S rRNA (guanine(527)-N(7))-methyltransferase RsmG [Rhizobium sp. 18065]|uniref:16S rRNA (guanine(527)-N(7))-methyltransferase RsmG n=1 Tax=Rhizobium sp. 18065 TaxID=2681411 RepID=UPI0013592A2D|nr:16S rRNA (guanine(527)-N(7))-methyltransferase RsmG [Rhizobium sp. 18065]
MLGVSRETQGRLQRFAELFMKWSAKINLVAPSTIDALWTRHIADSLQLRNIVPEAKHWIDLGSGGGFPGIVTAIVLAEHGQGWVDLVESNHKKASFLRMALLETGGRGSVHPLRIEEAGAKLPEADVISARALAELDLLLAYAEPWAQRNPELRMVFHKGRDYLDEIDKARGRWAFDLVTHQSAVEADSVILEIASLKRRG